MKYFSDALGKIVTSQVNIFNPETKSLPGLNPDQIMLSQETVKKLIESALASRTAAETMTSAITSSDKSKNRKKHKKGKL